MSEYNIPFHVQEEIMKRLPVKSLIEFRSVSKTWKSLIDSSEFIAAHSLRRHTQPHHLLVSYEDEQEELSYVCYFDDDTFPLHRSVLTLPLSAKQLIHPKIVGSSHGLVCLYGSDPIRTTGMTVVWNPSIRKYIVVAVPAKPNGVGFGVCPVTNDPKIVSITQSSRGVPEASYKCEVMVYTLSSGKWRSLSTNLPTKPMWNLFNSVVTDGFIYWCAGLPGRNMIMSFDVTSESVEMIDLPDMIVVPHPGLMQIFKLRESLVMLQNGIDFFTVWMVEHGAQISFTKLFTIKTPRDDVVGFRINGIPILRVTDDDDVLQSKLVVYEPNSEHNNALEISPSFHYFDANSYVETLLLLGRSDCNCF